jgi:hypothetical protein
MGVNTEIVLCGEREREEWVILLNRRQLLPFVITTSGKPSFNRHTDTSHFNLLARDGGRVQGVLPLVLVRSRLFGSSLTSMPFLDYGGVCTEHEDVRAALVRRAQLLMHEHTVDCVELRQRAPTGTDGTVRLDKVGMVLDLSPGIEALWTGLPAKTRNQVRKAQKSGLTVVSGGGRTPRGVLCGLRRKYARLGLAGAP